MATPRRHRRLAAFGVGRCWSRRRPPAAWKLRWRDAAAAAPTLVVRMACCRVWHLLPYRAHDSSDIVRACVRSHESGIEYIRYTIRIETAPVSHGPKFRKSSYTSPAAGPVTRCFMFGLCIKRDFIEYCQINDVSDTRKGFSYCLSNARLTEVLCLHRSG